MKAEDEFYAGGAVEASAEFGKIIEEISWRDGGEEGVGVTQLLNPHCFDVGDDEVVRANFHCTDPVFVVCPRLTYVFHAAHLRYAVVFPESCDSRVVIFTCCAHEAKGSSPDVGLLYLFR